MARCCGQNAADLDRHAEGEWPRLASRVSNRVNIAGA